MGLSICYDLRLSGATTDEEAVRMLERLRTHALTLETDITTPVLLLTGTDLLLPEDVSEPRTVEWLLRILSEGVRQDRDGEIGPIDDPSRLVVAGFVMGVGEGSEPAAFGLVRPLVEQPPSGARDDNWRHWLWQGFCKTQYASAVSDEHFVKCHLIVVSMLDEAKRIGFDVTVYDDGLYWDTRSRETLLLELQKMNRLMARFAGALHDALSPDRSVEAAIFEHPDFEHLEMERG
jgi:hypothetical protein